MDHSNEPIADLEYRTFMVKLSRQFNSQDLNELKYMLTSMLPAGIMESLNTPLDVFLRLERLMLVGPNNLQTLERLLRSMGKKRLSSMISSFLLKTSVE